MNANKCKLRWISPRNPKINKEPLSEEEAGRIYRLYLELLPYTRD